jgi:hypothetical protein
LVIYGQRVDVDAFLLSLRSIDSIDVIAPLRVSAQPCAEDFESATPPWMTTLDIYG